MGGCVIMFHGLMICCGHFIIFKREYANFLIINCGHGLKITDSSIKNLFLNLCNLHVLCSLLYIMAYQIYFYFMKPSMASLSLYINVWFKYELESARMVNQGFISLIWISFCLANVNLVQIKFISLMVLFDQQNMAK